MKRMLSVLIIISFILSGCWDQKIYEKIGFSLQIGIESSKKGEEILFTSTLPAIGAKEKYGIEMLTTTADIVREGRENHIRAASKKIAGGKIQQLLFSEEIAKKGIHDLFEVFERDPEGSRIAWVVVVEGSPHELLVETSKFKDIPGPALYINQLIENNVKDLNAPETRIYDFDVNYFAPGIDPITPLIRLETSDLLVVGSALFSDDKMVGKIDHKQTGLLLGMMGQHKKAEFSYISSYPPGMSPEGKEEFAITLTGGKRKIDVKLQNGKPEVNISLSYKGYMQEYGWDNLSDGSTQEKVEKHLGTLIKKDCIEVIKYMQQAGSDPIGIGEIVRAKYYNYWNITEWKDAYKDAEINVEAKVDIKEYGAID